MTIDYSDLKTVFVMGPPCSGKRTFIKHRFPEHFVVDLHEFQDGTIARASTWQSYLLCKDALVEALGSHEKVVLKHTLMKAKRRPMYIEAVRSVLGDGAPIACWHSFPTIDEYSVYDRLDFERWSKTHTSSPFDGPASESELARRLREFEVPTIEEGFSEVHRIQDEYPLQRHRDIRSQYSHDQKPLR